MPINFLQNIKSLSLPATAMADIRSLSDNRIETRPILGIYTFSCVDLEGKQPLFNDGIPSLILMPKKSDTVLLKTPKEHTLLSAAWLCCGVIKNVHWEVPPHLEYISVIRFNPAFFYSFFDIAPTVFASKSICDLKDLVSDRWMKTFDRFYERKTVESRISFVTEVFSPSPSNNTNRHDFPQLLTTAIELIDTKQGNVAVNSLLQQIGIANNPKWLHRNFVKYLGISPKKYISLQRFIYAYERCKKNNARDYFDVALHLGYYDYNHFLKDFKEYIGASPTQYKWD
ncbi:helix-turn-helix domain-containing protein [Sphingobacterium tabacisoli]|uniref:Helix-turn-helix domain-containing protein n=1 Tax=Sphingobacterium tabacisoli TaxID=2044855 RepID=A0ABW5L4L7_9SPHI|nr:helix-turn-helix domain-containing protein [Sphingobacterium tabacisoli]